MNRSSSFRPLRFFSKDALKALLFLVGERFPAQARKTIARLRAGGDLNAELLAPVRLMVYGILGEKSFERYTRYEREALSGNKTAEMAWLRMLHTCRMLVNRSQTTKDFCLN